MVKLLLFIIGCILCGIGTYILPQPFTYAEWVLFKYNRRYLAISLFFMGVLLVVIACK